MSEAFFNQARQYFKRAGLISVASFFANILKFVLRLMPGTVSCSKQVGAFGDYRFHSDYMFSDFRNWSSAHNQGFSALIEACTGKSCVLDIGAHIGNTVMPISRVVSKGATVHAFEPSIRNRLMLETHLSLNSIDNVVVIDSVLGDQVATDVHFSQHKRVSGMNSLAKKTDHDIWENLVVNMTTIDEYCRQQQCIPDVIKIDVEGAEAMVWAGARETLKAQRPIIFMSVHPRQLIQLDSSVMALRDMIEELNYVVLAASGVPVGGPLKFSEYILVHEKVTETAVRSAILGLAV